ncbi:hypothetical protein [Prosthecobacter sp.]|uniref:hypothetical protein n=1 Tax=Prosthecobacter sp. TaxID=1965333 RepID=UPI0037840E30
MTREATYAAVLLLMTGYAAAQQAVPTTPAATASTPAAAPTAGAAVVPGPAQAAGSRLQQMESIYQKELSARHIPLLGKYLAELQRQAATTADKSAYDAEIRRVQQIISAGGALDLIATQQAQSGAMPMPAPMPQPPVPAEQKQALIALSPALAQESTPKAAADATTATIGEISWRIEYIAAGNYDLLLHYACPELPDPLIVRVEFNGQTLEKELEVKRMTADTKTFRILRLGSLVLTNDLRGETLRLSAGEKASPHLIVKSLLITRPRPAVSNP